MKTTVTLMLSALLLFFIGGFAFAEDPAPAPEPAPDGGEAAPPPDAPQPPDQGGGEEEDGMKILRETRQLMDGLASELLPNVNDPAKLQKAQEDEKAVVANLDKIIKMIIDQGAEEQPKKQEEEQQQEKSEEEKKKEEEKKQQNPQNSGKKEEKKEQPSDQPPKKAGKNPRGKGGADEGTFEGREADEWGLLPEKEYEESATVRTTVAPKGYESLVERFRRTIAREGARIPK